MKGRGKTGTGRPGGVPAGAEEGFRGDDRQERRLGLRRERRSTEWLKVKVNQEGEFVIGGYMARRRPVTSEKTV